MTQAGPLEAFQRNSSNLYNTAATVQGTKAGADASYDAYTVARSVHDDALDRHWASVGEVLDQVHDAITEDTDPIEYLEAVGSVLHDGVLVEYGDILRAMRTAMLKGPIPVAIVSTTNSAVAFGRSRGDIHVSREPGLFRHRGVQNLLNFAIPLDELHEYGYVDAERHELKQYVHPLVYRGTRSASPHMISVKQPIEAIRATDKKTGVRAAIAAADHADEWPGEGDYHRFFLRSVETAGMVPVIAFGHQAVASVLRNVGKLAEQGKLAQVDPAQVAATAINIGINPADIATNRSKVRTGLEEAFAHSIATMINSQVSVDISGMLGAWADFRSDPPPAATAKVMEYLHAADSVPAIARKTLQPIFAESIMGSEDRFLRATLFVAGALGRLLGIEIDREVLMPSKTTDPTTASANTQTYL